VTLKKGPAIEETMQGCQFEVSTGTPPTALESEKLKEGGRHWATDAGWRDVGVSNPVRRGSGDGSGIPCGYLTEQAATYEKKTESERRGRFQV